MADLVVRITHGLLDVAVLVVAVVVVAVVVVLWAVMPLHRELRKRR